jgi:hypothetical protein
MFTIFFSGEKFGFLNFSPKSQNMDSYYFCTAILTAGPDLRASYGPMKSKDE